MKQYLDLLQHILDRGSWKQNRTGVKTLSVFGYQTRYDLSKDFPLLTTKKVYFKGIVQELLWFIKGDTNIAYLVNNDCNIWNDWPYAKYKESNAYQNESMQEFIQKIKNDPAFAKKYGDLGPVYGKQWRDFFGVDQLKDVIDNIKNNPDSRRLIVCSWNAKDIPNMALAPCHCLFQFYVNDNQLSCQLYQRSADAFLGVPFNISSYALLTLMICHLTGLKPGEFIHSFGDLHIYENHLDQVKLQLSRTPKKLPKLMIKNHHKKIEDIQYDDIVLIDYDPEPAIKAPVAV